MPLTGRVLEEDAQSAQPQASHGLPDRVGTGLNPFLRGTPASASRMDDEVFSSQVHRADDLLPEGTDGSLSHRRAHCRKIDEIRSMDDDGIEPISVPLAMKRANLLASERACLPPSRIAGEELHGLTSQGGCFSERADQLSRDRGVNAQANTLPDGHVLRLP
jgi:hypothetical protein